MTQVVLIVSLSVTVAMYCLIQIYMPVSEQLAPHKPLLKLFAIKAVGELVRYNVLTMLLTNSQCSSRSGRPLFFRSSACSELLKM